MPYRNGSIQGSALLKDLATQTIGPAYYSMMFWNEQRRSSLGFFPYQWVDDINLLAIGTQRLFEIHSPNATLELLAGLRNISPKLHIVAFRPVLAKRLASLLELEGEHLKVDTVGPP